MELKAKEVEASLMSGDALPALPLGIHFDVRPEGLRVSWDWRPVLGCEYASERLRV